MSVKTLEELKAENAAAEAESVELVPQTDDIETEPEEAALEVEEETEGLAEPEEEPETEPEVECWMQSEADDSQDDSAVDDSQIWATARKKYKAKSEKEKQAHNEEIEKLRAEMEALKQQPQAVQAPTGKPKRDDFLDHDDPDEAYLDALFNWRNADQASKQAQADQQAKQQEFINKINTSVDNHYDRAAKLSAANNIKPEVYQQADAVVRNRIGEDLTNTLIAQMGDGSEKVMFNLGRNPTKLAALQAKLSEDPTGLQAMMLLGEMKSDLTPKQRKTMAPRPAKTVKGDQGTGESHKALKKKYQAAFKAGDMQKSFDIRKQARAAGADLTNW